MSVTELLRKMPAAFRPDSAGDSDCVVQFDVSTPMHLIIRNRVCHVKDGTARAADVTITMEDADLEALLRGELNGMTAFMTGKLECEGDLSLAQRVFGFFDPGKLN